MFCSDNNLPIIQYFFLKMCKDTGSYFELGILKNEYIQFLKRFVHEIWKQSAEIVTKLTNKLNRGFLMGRLRRTLNILFYAQYLINSMFIKISIVMALVGILLKPA